MADEEPINEQQPQDDAAEANAETPETGEDPAGEVAESADPAPDGGETPEASAAEQLATEAIDAAQQAAASIEQDAGAENGPGNGTANGARFGPAGASAPAPFTPEQLSQLASVEGGESIDILADVDLNVKIELGRTRMLVEDVLRLTDGAVVELDKLAGDPVDIFVNDRHVARGEVLILNDNFCVRVSEILEATIEER